MDETLYLAHYGVKGMKWGVRKSPKKSSTISKKDYRKKLAVKAGLTIAVIAMTNPKVRKVVKDTAVVSFNTAVKLANNPKTKTFIRTVNQKPVKDLINSARRVKKALQ